MKKISNVSYIQLYQLRQKNEKCITLILKKHCTPKNGVQCIFIVLVYDSMYFALMAYLLGCKTILRVVPNISYIVFSVSGGVPLAPRSKLLQGATPCMYYIPSMG